MSQNTQNLAFLQRKAIFGKNTVFNIALLLGSKYDWIVEGGRGLHMVSTWFGAETAQNTQFAYPMKSGKGERGWAGI